MLFGTTPAQPVILRAIRYRAVLRGRAFCPEMSLDDVELELPGALEAIDPDEHADCIKEGPASPIELEPVSGRAGRRR